MSRFISHLIQRSLQESAIRPRAAGFFGADVLDVPPPMDGDDSLGEHAPMRPPAPTASPPAGPPSWPAPASDPQQPVAESPPGDEGGPAPATGVASERLAGLNRPSEGVVPAFDRPPLPPVRVHSPRSAPLLPDREESATDPRAAPAARQEVPPERPRREQRDEGHEPPRRTIPPPAVPPAPSTTAVVVPLRRDAPAAPPDVDQAPRPPDQPARAPVAVTAASPPAASPPAARPEEAHPGQQPIEPAAVPSPIVGGFRPTAPPATPTPAPRPPSVQVTIGRVEVRAVFAPPPPPVPPPAPAPIMSLDDYLSQRDRGS